MGRPPADGAIRKLPPWDQEGPGVVGEGENGRSRKVVDSTRHGNLSLRLRIPSACGGQDVHAPGGTSARMRLKERNGSLGGYNHLLLPFHNAMTLDRLHSASHDLVGLMEYVTITANRST